MHEQQCRQAGVVRMLASDLKAVDRFLARKQALYGRRRNGVIGTLLIRQSQEHVGIEKPTH
jgi:hypothetical protein